MSKTLAQAVAGFEPLLPLAVAYSGGADSTALLLACAARWPGQVSAIHVHHGLQAAADDFEQHCRAFCLSLGVRLTVLRVHARAAPGQSPEDAARIARYEAFDAAALAERGDLAIKNEAIQDRPFRSLALAQHADDQAETVLLALSRGAGLAGLAAMPAAWQRHGVNCHRPLLEVAAADIRLWLRERGAAFIEDPSNADQRFTRNRIRARLMPALEATFPAFRETFARSASHAAQAQQLLQELAEQDLLALGCPPAIQPLQALSRARQANLLRHWLRQVHQAVPSAAQLGELLDQVGACTTRGHRIHLKVGAGFVRREGDILTWYNSGA